MNPPKNKRCWWKIRTGPVEAFRKILGGDRQIGQRPWVWSLVSAKMMLFSFYLGVAKWVLFSSDAPQSSLFDGSTICLMRYLSDRRSQNKSVSRCRVYFRNKITLTLHSMNYNISNSFFPHIPYCWFREMRNSGWKLYIIIIKGYNYWRIHCYPKWKSYPPGCDLLPPEWPWPWWWPPPLGIPPPIPPPKNMLKIWLTSTSTMYCIVGG